MLNRESTTHHSENMSLNICAGTPCAFSDILCISNGNDIPSRNSYISADSIMVRHR